LACLSPSRKYRDPKVQRFTEVMIAHCKDALASLDMSLKPDNPERTE
jgi:hypothetical protein